MKIPKPHPAVIFIIFFVIVILIFFHKSIFTKQVLIPASILKSSYPWRAVEEFQRVDKGEYTDAIFNAYPFSLHVSRSIKEKIVPKWNPYIFCGTPFFASPGIGFFDPFNILHFFISPVYGFTIKIILSVFLSCLFMALLVWKLTRNHIASLLSGLIYGFNGLLMQNLSIPQTLGFMVWLPCLFLFLICDAQRHNYGWGAAAGLIIAVQILNGAGYGNLLFYTIVAVLSFGLYFSRLSTALFSIGLGILLSAVQLLPSIEFAKYCHRSQPLFSLTSIYAIPATLITALFPDFFGIPYQDSWWGYYLYRYLFNTNLASSCVFAYAGVVSAFLVLLVIGRKTDNRYYIFFGWLTIAVFFFSHFYPVLAPILRFVPVLNKLRSHERALWLYMFSLSVMAGLGLSSLMRRDISPSRLNRVKKGLAAILIISIVLTAIGSTVISKAGEKLVAAGKVYVREHYGTARFSTGYRYPLSYYNHLIEDIILIRLKNSFSFKSFPYWRSILCLLAALSVFIIYSKNIDRTGLGWLCIALVLFDLFSYGLNRYTCVAPETVYPSTPAIKLLQKKSREDYSRIIGLWQQKLFKDRGEFSQNIFTPEILPSASSLIFKLYDSRGYFPLYPKDYGDFCEELYPGAGNYMNLIIFPDFNQRLFDLLSVRYILTAPGYDMPRDNLELVYDAEIRIYENKNALPRVFLAPEIKNVEDREETLRILCSPDFAPRRLSLVMGYEGGHIFDSQSILEGNSRIIDFQANKVAIEASMKAESPLVLTDTYFPGWKAFIDGNETKIYRANYIHRMVVVPQGKHLVEFIYDPLSFKTGAIISVAAFAGCSIFVIFFLRNKGRSL